MPEINSTNNTDTGSRESGDGAGVGNGSGNGNRGMNSGTGCGDCAFFSIGDGFGSGPDAGETLEGP